MKVYNVELTDAQAAAIVAEAISEMTEDEVVALFVAAMKANRNSVDHVTVAQRFARAVEKECALARGYVLGRQQGFAFIEACIVVAALAAIAAIILGVHHESQAWEAFKVEKECAVVERIRGYYEPRTTWRDGKAVTESVHVPNRTKWKCSDGVVYTR